MVIANSNKKLINSLVVGNETNASNLLDAAADLSGPPDNPSDSNNIMVKNEDKAINSLKSNAYGGFTLSISCCASGNNNDGFGTS